ncbi:MAG: hypothetical protein AAFU55_04660 [Pseudomonadota bacterium]
MRFQTYAAAFAACIAATAAQADITVDFLESAPKDRFSIRNVDACETGPVRIDIDLAGSAGRLIFDTTASGAGVEVFQPFQLVAGAEKVASVTPVGDGDEAVSFQLSSLAPGEIVAFTVDVDDRLADSSLGQIRVDGSEIAGAIVKVAFEDEPLEARFDASSKARLPYSACLS